MIMAEIQDTIREIKSKFRLFMNGMVSQSMREKGIDYKLNFGIEYPRIKEIAADYPCSHELAQALWKENIRECKIMAGLLQPVDGFCREIAEIWIEDMRYPGTGGIYGYESVSALAIRFRSGLSMDSR